MNLLFPFGPLINLLFAIIGIGVVVLIHELGHFLFCKLFNMPAPLFSIGFGPALFQKKIGETTFMISAIPLGGYVQIGDSDDENVGNAMNSLAYYKKVLILAGGIIFNLVSAYILTVALLVNGFPAVSFTGNITAGTTVTIVDSAGPANDILLPGDIITSWNNTPITRGKEIFTLIEKDAVDEPARINILRGENPVEIVLYPRVSTCEKLHPRHYGFNLNLVEAEPLRFGDALIYAFSIMNNLARGLLSALHNAITSQSTENLGGPLSIFAMGANFASKGFSYLFFYLLFFSVNIAFMNALPIPILDGGQILFATITSILRRPLSEKAEMIVGYGSWLLMAGLMLYLLFKDICMFAGW